MGKEKNYLLKCNCGCGMINFSVWDIDEDEQWMGISHYPEGFGAYQVAQFWFRVKIAWRFLIGKQFWLWDIQAPLEKFINTLRQIITDYDNGEF